MKLGFKRGQRGFTLVELMVVMAVMAVLATIVVPAVTGTKQVSEDAQVQQDASAVETAVNDYNADSNLAEELTTTDAILVGLDSGSQETSSKWPEKAISGTGGAYATIFADSGVTKITLIDGDTTYATGDLNNDVGAFVGAFNAIDFTKLAGYLTEEPASLGTKFDSKYDNYLWLVEKVATQDDTGTDKSGRVLAVFSLTTVVTGDELTYERIY